MPVVRIDPARSPEDLEAVTLLFREYAVAVPHASGIEADLAGLPGRYGPPGGLLLLARVDDAPAGCVAYRTIDPGGCEMKRLYVRPDARGLGIGRGLVARAIGEAADRGFRRMLLDTSRQMPEAFGIYRSAGFREVPPYWDSPVPDVVYLGLDLVEGPSTEGRITHHDS